MHPPGCAGISQRNCGPSSCATVRRPYPKASENSGCHSNRQDGPAWGRFLVISCSRSGRVEAPRHPLGHVICSQEGFYAPAGQDLQISAGTSQRSAPNGRRGGSRHIIQLRVPVGSGVCFPTSQGRFPVCGRQRSALLCPMRPRESRALTRESVKG